MEKSIINPYIRRVAKKLDETQKKHKKMEKSIINSYIRRVAKRLDETQKKHKELYDNLIKTANFGKKLRTVKNSHRLYKFDRDVVRQINDIKQRMYAVRIQNIVGGTNMPYDIAISRNDRNLIVKYMYNNVPDCHPEGKYGNSMYLCKFNHEKFVRLIIKPTVENKVRRFCKKMKIKYIEPDFMRIGHVNGTNEIRALKVCKLK
jgi:hypothetical protein